MVMPPLPPSQHTIVVKKKKNTTFHNTHPSIYLSMIWSIRPSLCVWKHRLLSSRYGRRHSRCWCWCFLSLLFLNNCVAFFFLVFVFALYIIIIIINVHSPFFTTFHVPLSFSLFIVFFYLWSLSSLNANCLLLFSMLLLSLLVWTTTIVLSY